MTNVFILCEKSVHVSVLLAFHWQDWHVCLEHTRDLTQRNVFTMDNVTVQQATFSDYDAVMEISKGIYGGADQLPSLYYIHLHDKNSNSFVLTVNNKIVSYSTYSIFPLE